MAKTNLVIVESPAKAKTIGKYLGPDYEVRASMGHLRDLPKSKLGVDVEHDFEPNYRGSSQRTHGYGVPLRRVREVALKYILHKEIETNLFYHRVTRSLTEF